MASSMIRYTVTLNVINANVAAIGTPVRLASVATQFSKATFWGLKVPRTNNTGTVFLGVQSSNDSQPIPITAGNSLTIEAPASQAYDLSTFYLDAATAGDGVIVLYS